MSKRDLYYKMMNLIEQEEDVVKRVRKAEEEVKKKHIWSIDFAICYLFRHVIYNLVVNKKNFRAIWKSVFTISIEMKNRKSTENYW